MKHFNLLGRCIYRVFFRPGDAPIRWTRSRILAMVVWLPICLVLGVMHWICLLLDEILFPGYRRVEVREPLFIVGPPRSGTTFLHRVLSKDTERFAYFSFGEMVFTPSIVQRKIAGGIWWLDRLLGNPLRRGMQRVEKHWFEPYSHMHRVSLFEAEEDFVMLGYIAANHLLLVVFPFPDLFGTLWTFDRDMPKRDQQRIMRFYKRCLQRHLYYHGPGKTHLSKNPFFTPMIQSVRDEFPDAKFLCNIRDPYENVPSFLSIWNALYGGIGNAPDHYLARDFILEWVRDAYLYGGRKITELGPGSGQVVPYGPLVSKPRETVLDIYRSLGYEVSPTYLKILDDEAAQAREYRSRHNYGILEYGLTEADLYERFREVFDYYAFPPPDSESRGEAEAIPTGMDD
jgi:hypothetical protein